MVWPCLDPAPCGQVTSSVAELPHPSPMPSARGPNLDDRLSSRGQTECRTKALTYPAGVGRGQDKAYAPAHAAVPAPGTWRPPPPPTGALKTTKSRCLCGGGRKGGMTAALLVHFRRTPIARPVCNTSHGRGDVKSAGRVEWNRGVSLSPTTSCGCAIILVRRGALRNTSAKRRKNLRAEYADKWEPNGQRPNRAAQRASTRRRGTVSTSGTSR